MQGMYIYMFLFHISQDFKDYIFYTISPFLCVSILNFIGQFGNFKSKDMQYGMAPSRYEGIDGQQWDGATGKKTDICGMHLHPSGILGATPDLLLGEETV